MTTAAAKHLQLVVTQPSIAARLQTQLKDAESAFDITAAHAGELIAKTMEAARIAGIHRVNIQPHLKQLTASIEHALEGQMQLQRFHQGCRNFMKKIDLDAVGFGDTGDTPDFVAPAVAADQAAAAAQIAG